MRDNELIAITTITGDSTGCYSVGSLDYAIQSNDLLKYLEKNGRDGRDEIVRKLAYLIHRVYEYYDNAEISLK